MRCIFLIFVLWAPMCFGSSLESPLSGVGSDSRASQYSAPQYLEFIAERLRKPGVQVILAQSIMGSLFMGIGTELHFQCSQQVECVQSTTGLPLMILGGGLLISSLNRCCECYIGSQQTEDMIVIP